MSNEKPLVNKKYLLQKFEGKGGWTYAQIPEILQDKHAHFGWVRVKGTIDNYEIKIYRIGHHYFQSFYNFPYELILVKIQ